MMQVVIGVSNKHVHLSEEDCKILFGDVPMEKEKDLLQPGQYASNLKVKIKTEKREIDGVRVLGPFRDYTQVELSRTDCYALGINAPVRMSGDLVGAAVVTIIGINGEITKPSAIIAARHIHLNPSERESLGLINIEKVKVKLGNSKKAILFDVYLKEDTNALLEFHVDTDDGNSNDVKTGDMAQIIVE